MKKSEVSLSLYAKMGYYEIENFEVQCKQCNSSIRQGSATKDDDIKYFCSEECFRDFNIINGKDYV